MKKFEVGKTYYDFSVYKDHTYTIKVIKRTRCTITAINKYGTTVILRIHKGASVLREAETVFPVGMGFACPIISADCVEEENEIE